jgi:cytochrome c553
MKSKRNGAKTFLITVICGIPLLYSVSLLSAGTTTTSELVELGKQKAETCSICHGEQGKAHNNMLPNLAGQNKGYFKKQLHDFRERRRMSSAMREVARTLTDRDIEALAAYYSSLD